ncbi:ATPase [Geotalea uraniireducens]|uniref:ATPase n=1 Tax=Geotalea uraniireducens TaxID=351604 RepID=A0ABM8EKV6_9BACT|nr:XrtA/PEP-CTERM system-associated ATPase [Geotalea uraniireducens]BDV43030.1 ATPase [Geotalea uraniireducens]
MYESFFNLKAKPFELVPDTSFLYLSKVHKRAITYLDYGIRERAGFILLTGEVGAGKTTIIRNMVKRCDEDAVLARIFNTSIDSLQLLAMINEEFGLSSAGKGKVELLKDLNDFLIDQYAQGKRAVLIIDEAQNLAPALLEEIRMLSNLETDNGKLLQIILVGQPELRDMIATPDMLQLRQRVSINCHLQPMSRQETEEYILHRLEVAGGRNAVTFSAEAFDLIYMFSRGIPRLINIICDFLMLSAFAEETTTLDGAMVRDIAGDLDFEKQYWGEQETADDAGEAAKAAEPGAGSEIADRLTSLLEEIRNRMDLLENRMATPDREVIGEMMEKLASLENAFLFHVRETDSLVAEISKRLERVSRYQFDELESPESDKPAKQGLVTRLFGKSSLGNE